MLPQAHKWVSAGRDGGREEREACVLTPSIRNEDVSAALSGSSPSYDYLVEGWLMC